MIVPERVAAFGARSTISGSAGISPSPKSRRSARHRVCRPLDYPAPLGLDRNRTSRLNQRVSVDSWSGGTPRAPPRLVAPARRLLSAPFDRDRQRRVRGGSVEGQPLGRVRKRHDRVVGGYQNISACTKGLDSYLSRIPIVNDGKFVTPQRPREEVRVSYMNEIGGGTQFVTLQCLPDTIDPRGPKGSDLFSTRARRVSDLRRYKDASHFHRETSQTSESVRRAKITLPTRRSGENRDRRKPPITR